MRFDDNTPEPGSIPAIYPCRPPLNLVYSPTRRHPRNLFAFEGADGAGKSTLLRTVIAELSKNHLESVKLKLAGSEMVRHAMERAKWLNVDPISFNLLNWTSLFHQLSEHEHLLNTSQPILFDRFTLTIRVRGTLEGLHTSFMDQLEPLLPEPTRFFVIDCDPRTCVERLVNSERELSYFETGSRHVAGVGMPMKEDGEWQRRNRPISVEQRLAVITRMRDHYLRLAEARPQAKIIDNSGDLSTAAAEVTRDIVSFLAATQS